MAGRSETRDLVDILVWDQRFSLALVVWAACGKDPGFNPLSLLEQMRRSARIDPGQLRLLKARNIDPQRIKPHWLATAEQTEAALVALADAQPDLPTGVIFIDRHGSPAWPNPLQPIASQDLAIHAPSVGGCIPLVRPSEPYLPV